MAQATTTIRVPRQVRDSLARSAEAEAPETLAEIERALVVILGLPGAAAAPQLG